MGGFFFGRGVSLVLTNCLTNMTFFWREVFLFDFCILYTTSVIIMEQQEKQNLNKKQLRQKQNQLKSCLCFAAFGKRIWPQNFKNKNSQLLAFKAFGSITL